MKQETHKMQEFGRVLEKYGCIITWTDKADNYMIVKKDSDNVEHTTKSEYIPGRRKPIFDRAQYQKMENMVHDGISKNSIAKAFGVSEKTIRNYLSGKVRPREN